MRLVRLVKLGVFRQDDLPGIATQRLSYFFLS